MAQSKAALRVGTVVVIAALLLAGVAYFFIGRTAGGYPVDVTFRDAQGIKEEAEVRLAGVRIGTVKKVQVQPDGHGAVLELRIRAEQPLPRGYTYTITSGGLLGELFVNITPPPAGVRVARGEVRRTGTPPPVIQGTDLPTFDDIKLQVAQLGAGSQDVLANLKTATGNLAAISNDPVLRRALRTAALNAEAMSRQGLSTTARLDSAAAQVNATLARGLPSIQSALNSVDRAARNVETATRQAGPMAGNANQMLLKATELVKGLDETNRFLRDTIGDTMKEADAGPQLNQTLKNLAAASEQFKLAAEDARKITQDLATSDQGGSKVGQAVTAVQAAATKAGTLLDRLTGVTDRATKRKGPLLKAVPQVDLYQQMNGDTRFRADLNVAFPGTDNGALILGLRDLGEGNKLNLQYSIPTGDRLRLRYGFHAGRVGLGTDYDLSRRAVPTSILSPPGASTLSAELYDPNHMQLDVYGRYQFNDTLGMALGFEDVMHHSHPTVGLTYRP
jgi:phospholipid/cholesterol/gamma-HCH transport system substrate-binding protein